MRYQGGVVALVIVLLMAGLSSSALGWGKPQISSTSGMVSIEGFTITVTTRNAEGKWAGCTIRNRKTGRIVADLDASRLTDRNSKTWVITDMGSGRDYEYIVCLWDGIVYAEDCRRRDPSDGKRPCRYCRENGYHMEPFGNPLDCSDWKVILTGGW